MKLMHEWEVALNVLMNRRSVICGTVALTLGSKLNAESYVNEKVKDPGYVVNGTKRWLMPNFGHVIREKVRNTPFSFELLCAMAYQESGYRWWSSKFRGKRTPSEVLRLLVLDNVAGRKVFPADTEAFKADPRFNNLADGLIAAADAASEAEGNGKPGMLRYGYGLFQNDLQNIESDPWFWKDQAPGEPNGVLGLWGDINASTDYCLRELRRKYDRTRNVYEAVRAYNGRGKSADIYLYNVQVYEHGLLKANL